MSDALLDVYRRLAACCPAWQVRVLTGERAEPGAEWVSAAGFAERVEELVAGEAARIRARHGSAVPAHVAASRLLHHYLWTTCLLASGPWYLAGQVPALPVAAVWIEPATGELAVRAEGAAPIGGPAELRAAVAEHVEPVLEAFRPVAKRGSRALWGMVTDDLVSGIWYLGRMLGCEEHAVAQAELVLPGGTAPMVGSADFRRLGGAGELTRTRVGCCLYYAVRPDEACLTCPRTGDAERARRLAGV
ncbi:(2Fe-2S)-binding protein [Kitasatospora azatica]|uniref:(2Fe-2S)-binding protein n=1 Tax=Kitasatospora azatica TaxID=58347 RepID=UPI0006900FCD|nr:(2Fe-2S)-binding protein [Kitasatospora azatica]